MRANARPGTLVAAAIPLVAALTGVGIVTAGTTALAAVTQISSAAVTVALMLAWPARSTTRCSLCTGTGPSSRTGSRPRSLSPAGRHRRGTFERLRLLHAYGVLAYDMFTAADDLAHLVMEQALRDRFVEFHQGLVPFEDAHGTVHEVPATSFDALYEEIYAEG